MNSEVFKHIDKITQERDQLREQLRDLLCSLKSCDEISQLCFTSEQLQNVRRIRDEAITKAEKTLGELK